MVILILRWIPWCRRKTPCVGRPCAWSTTAGTYSPLPASSQISNHTSISVFERICALLKACASTKIGLVLRLAVKFKGFFEGLKKLLQIGNNLALGCIFGLTDRETSRRAKVEVSQSVPGRAMHSTSTEYSRGNLGCFLVNTATCGGQPTASFPHPEKWMPCNPVGIEPWVDSKCTLCRRF